MIPIWSAVISGITGFFTKKQEIKAAHETAKAKLLQKKADSSATIEMTDAEWESLALRSQQNSWKDEYVTLIITLPILFILLGSVLAAMGFPSGTEIVKGSLEGIKELKSLGMDYGFLMNAVVMAAIGLKVWRA